MSTNQNRAYPGSIKNPSSHHEVGMQRANDDAKAASFVDDETKQRNWAADDTGCARKDFPVAPSHEKAFEVPLQPTIPHLMGRDWGAPTCTRHYTFGAVSPERLRKDALSSRDTHGIPYFVAIPSNFVP